MNISLMPLVIRKMPMKTIMNHQCTPILMAKTKSKSPVPSAGECSEQLELSYTDSQNEYYTAT